MQILDNGIGVTKGQVEHLWFRIQTPEGPRYRVLTLGELAVLPRPLAEMGERESLDFFRRQVAIIRGLYNAGVDFLYVATGLFRPQRLGVAQMYGAAAEAASLEEAVRLARQRFEAVQASMANYIQSRLRFPDPDVIRAMLDLMLRSRKILLLIGYPDPREGIKTPDDNLVRPDDLSTEQNEMLFRTLARAGKNFVFQVASRHVDRGLLVDKVVDFARYVSQIASRQRGTRNIGFTLSIPILAAVGQTLGAGHSRGRSESRGVADGVSQSWNQAHTEGYAYTEGIAHTSGGSVTVTHSEADTTGVAHGRAHTVSHSVSTFESTTHSTSTSHTSGSSASTSHSVGGSSSWSVGAAHTTGTATTHSASTSTGMTTGQSLTTGQSVTESTSMGGSVGYHASGNVAVGVPGTLGAGVSGGWNASVSMERGWSGTQSASQTASQSVSMSATQGVANTTSSASTTSHSVGGASTWGTATGSSTFSSTTTTTGVAHTTGRSESWGTADTTSETHSRAHTSGKSVSVSSFWSTTRSKAHTWSQSDTRGATWGRSHAENRAWMDSQARTMNRAIAAGLSTGVVPGVSIARSWQTEDELAIYMTNLLRQLEGILDRAAAEGGFLTHASLVVEDEEAAEIAAAAAPQAFHGPDSPTPLATVEPDPFDLPAVREHVLAFRPWQEGGADPFTGILWTRYATLLPPAQLAAYTAPGAFAEGTVKLVEPVPRHKLQFYSDLKGDVVLGHQYSPETMELTDTPVRFDPWAFMHFLFAGASGYGKSVAAERLVYELAKKLGFQVVVLDFGFGWRKMLNAPGLEGLVDVRQLAPFGPRPLRWNPLRISRYIPPTQFIKGFIDTWDQLTQMGQKQQRIWFETLVRDLYLEAGALTDDPDVWDDPQWGIVRPEEADRVGVSAETPLRDLVRRGDLDALQRLAVLRSAQLSLKDLYARIEAAMEDLAPRDRILKDILSGLLVRLRPLVVGATALQFAPGPDAVDLPDLLEGRRIVVFEGKGLDKRAAGFLLGWAGWVLYYDRVNRRQRQMDTRPLFMFYEEANVVFSGLSATGDRDAGTQSLAESYDNMVRDSRKYRIFFGFATQSPSLLPTGVLHSCPNLVIGRLTDPEDKKQVLSLLGFTEVGFQDNEMRRLLSDLSVAMMLGRLSYDFDRRMTQPFLFRPLLLDVPEPIDDEIAQKLGRVTL